MKLFAFPIALLALALTLALTLALALAAPAAAQRLTLHEAIDLAHERSPAADIAAYAYEASRWTHRAYRARYLPSLSISGNGPGLERSIHDIEQDDGTLRYVPSSRTFSRMTVSVDQDLPLTGGQVFLQTGLSRVDLFGDRRSNQWQSSPLLVGIRQPLFQFNDMRWERRMEPLRFEIARRAYAEDHAELAVDVAQRFFAVFIAQMNVENATFNVAVNDTIYTLSQGRFDIGRIAENDLLQSELQLINAQTAQAEAQIAYDRALQNLKLALDLPYDADLEIVPPTEIMDVTVAPQLAVRQARRNRAASIEMDLQTITAERELARARSNTGFSANLTASYGLNQSGVGLNDAYANPLNQQRVNMSFQIPVFQWGEGHAQRQAAEATLDETVREVDLQQQELEQEVYFEALAFAQLQRQVLTAAKADTIAARRFEVARNRYTIGKIDITDLFNAQREKDSARQTYVQTLRQYWTSYYDLRRLTLYDFERQRALDVPR